jgi:hypothetical protein
MSGVALILGPIEFHDFEVPAGINLGGTQRLAIHYLSGGMKVIDTLGRDDADISFSGSFSGSDATLRARVLDEMRVSGEMYALCWDVFLYSVVIKRFEADYRTGWWIPFRMTCAVLRDEASAFVEAIASAMESVLGDVASAGIYTAATGVDVSATSALLSQPNATTLGTSAYAAAAAALAQTNSNLDDTTSTAAAGLSGPTVMAAQGPIPAIAIMNAAVSSAGQLSSSVTARSYSGRAARNLANVST